MKVLSHFIHKHGYIISMIQYILWDLFPYHVYLFTIFIFSTSISGNYENLRCTYIRDNEMKNWLNCSGQNS